MVSNSNACWHLACFAIFIVYLTDGHQNSICSHAHSCLSHDVYRLTLHYMFCQCLHQFILYDQVANFLIYYIVHDVKYAQVMMSDSKKHQLLIECVLFTDFDLVKPSCLFVYFGAFLAIKCKSHRLAMLARKGARLASSPIIVRKHSSCLHLRQHAIST